MTLPLFAEILKEVDNQITANPQQQSTPVAPLKNPDGKLKRAIIFIIIFAATAYLIGGLIWVAGDRFNTKKACTQEAKKCPDGSFVGREGPNCEFTACPSINVSPTPTANPFDNWKTYINKEWGFSFKYPPVWSEEELENQNKEQEKATNEIGYMSFSIYFGNILEKNHIGEPVTPYVNNKLSITVFDGGKEKLSLEEAADKFPSCAGTSYGDSITESIEGRRSLLFRNSSCSLGSGSGIAYIQDGSKYYQIIDKVLTDEGNIDQILQTFKFLPSNEITSVPSNWLNKDSKECNISLALPPKETPYISDGSFWQFQQNYYENNLFKYSNSVLYANPKAGGSGYIPGLVAVSCSPNDENYTLDSLLDKYKQTLSDTSKEIKVSRVESLNLFGRKVYAVYIIGGMFDEKRPNYIFVTNKHIYKVEKVVMSLTASVTETAERIFSELQFKD